MRSAESSQTVGGYESNVLYSLLYNAYILSGTISRVRKVGGLTRPQEFEGF